MMYLRRFSADTIVLWGAATVVLGIIVLAVSVY